MLCFSCFVAVCFAAHFAVHCPIPAPQTLTCSHFPATMLSLQWDLALAIIILPESARICSQKFVAELSIGWEQSELRSPALLHKGSGCSLHLC